MRKRLSTNLSYRMELVSRLTSENGNLYVNGLIRVATWDATGGGDGNGAWEAVSGDRQEKWNDAINTFKGVAAGSAWFDDLARTVSNPDFILGSDLWAPTDDFNIIPTLMHSDELASELTYIDTATVAGGISTFRYYDYQSGVACTNC